MSRTDGPRATVSVRVVPRSSKEGVAGFEEGVLRIRLNAPPVEGKANEALVRFLAKALGVPKSRISLVAGEKGRNKIVRIDGITLDALHAALGL
ncbi:MAG: DUF167 domain-containing protein [bacterium]